MPQKDRFFRYEETQELMNYAKAGESASIIGVSGTGKSNLFNHLLNPAVQKQVLGDEYTNYLFIRVDFHHTADFSPRSMYSLMLEQFELLEERAEELGLEREKLERIHQCHEKLLDAEHDQLKVQRYFKQAVRILLGRSNRKLIFLFDQFREVYQQAESLFFANLRGLREDYKYRIAYFVFTRHILPDLAEMDTARDEFYELLSNNIIGLRPYNLADAADLLLRLEKRNTAHPLPVDKPLADQLIHLAGGHGGLLRASYIILAQYQLTLPPTPEEAAKFLLTYRNVEGECRKIWQSFTIEEQQVLSRVAHGVEVPAEAQSSADLLQTKGILTAEAKPRVFCPLFNQFCANQEEEPIRPDEQTKRIWVLGQPTERLTPREMDLFNLLYDRRGEIVERDELIMVGWPTAKGGVTEEMLNTTMYRLRRKIDVKAGGKEFIETVRGHGLRLNY